MLRPLLAPALAAALILCPPGAAPAAAETTPPPEPAVPTELPAGAAVPWLTYEAEAGQFQGQRLVGQSGSDPAWEASGRSGVRLQAVGDYVEWQCQAPADTIVVRHCIPDAPAGGGLSGTLSLYVNGQHRQDLTLDSTHSWLYGPGENPQDNNPASGGRAHGFFAEAHAFIAGGLQAGDRLRLQKDAADALDFYLLDLVDLEAAPPPSPRPENFLAVTDFGAVPHDGQDDSAAALAALAAAQAQGRGLWFGPGLFHLERQLDLTDGVQVRGAGLWHTRLYFTATPKKWTNVFALRGRRVEVSDLAIDSALTRRGFPLHGFGGAGDNWLIENVWIEHVNAGGWIGGNCSGGILRNCRIRGTYADGVNLQNGIENCLLENNHCRGTGDDSLAVFSNSEAKYPGGKRACQNITIRHNTLVAPWWGQGCGVYGGKNLRIEANEIQDAVMAPGIAVTTGFKCWPLESAVIVKNHLIRCGGTVWKRRWGAISVYCPGAALQGLEIRENVIQDAVHMGFQVAGYPGRDTTRIELDFAGNQIRHPGAEAVWLESSCRGSARIHDNRAEDLPPGVVGLKNDAPAEQFQVSVADNQGF